MSLTSAQSEIIWAMKEGLRLTFSGGKHKLGFDTVESSDVAELLKAAYIKKVPGLGGNYILTESGKKFERNV